MTKDPVLVMKGIRAFLNPDAKDIEGAPLNIEEILQLGSPAFDPVVIE